MGVGTARRVDTTSQRRRDTKKSLLTGKQPLSWLWSSLLVYVPTLRMLEKFRSTPGRNQLASGILSEQIAAQDQLYPTGSTLRTEPTELYSWKENMYRTI